MFAHSRLTFVISLLVTWTAAFHVQAQCCHPGRGYMTPVQGYAAVNPSFQMMAARIAAVQYSQLMNSHSQRAPTINQIARQGSLSSSQTSTSQQPTSSDKQQRRDAEQA